MYGCKLSEVDLPSFSITERVVEIVINYTDVRLCASKIFNHVIKTL